MGETRVRLGEAEDGLAVSAHTAGLRWRYGRLEASTPRLALSGACAFSLTVTSRRGGSAYISQVQVQVQARAPPPVPMGTECSHLLSHVA